MGRPLASAAFVLLAFLPAAGLAEIQYSVTPTDDNRRLTVDVVFHAAPGRTEFQMPNWAPGAYILSTPGRSVQDFTWDSGGTTVTTEHPAENSWTANVARGGIQHVRYTVPARFDADAIHYSGPSTYLYLVGRKEEPCRLDLHIPSTWKVAVGLDAVGNSTTQYTAPDYDTLADNPVTMGDFIDLHYTSHGKPITIALRGRTRDKVDQKKVVAMCKTISDTQGNFFGGFPFTKYVWHFSVFPGQDGGGGLEHLSSTQISLPEGVGPVCARVCAHEFFHLWNVKRIRSSVLGPFDYTQLPKTGALYWLEGVTDYYASVLTTRSGYLGEPELLKDLADNVNAVRSNPARLDVSPYESSYRVGDANGGRGNSGGYRISYYNLGWVVGLCLDLDLRQRTGNRKSLDDVERALWALCRNGQPGFAEHEIERQYVLAGGDKQFFRDVVLKAGELPVEKVLAFAGLKTDTTQRKGVDQGFTISTSPNSATLVLADVKHFAASAGAVDSAELLEVNGKSVVGANLPESIRLFGAALQGSAAGVPIQLKIRTGGAERDITLTPVETSTPVITVVVDPAATPAQVALRNAWLTGRTPK